jgi:hypothetical protein
MANGFTRMTALLAGLVLCTNAAAADIMQKLEPPRVLVKFPPKMQKHFLAGMRDHLAAVSQIQTALAEGKFDKAGQIASMRLGMSAPSSAACKPGMEHMNQMAKLMPDDMRKAGRRMHDAADQFAVDVKSADYRTAISSLSKVTQACVMCHAEYRVH